MSKFVSTTWTIRAAWTGALVLVLAAAAPAQDTATKEKTTAKQATKVKTRRPDVIFVPTPEPVVKRMLELAKVKKGDTVYDLGCGDGRIVVAAAKLGAKGKGFDIDPARIKDSLANVKKNKVEDSVEIVQADIFKLDLRPADVVTLYLLPSLNVKLIPQLEKLKPGTRIVSHDFEMAGVKPDKVIMVEAGGRNHPVYLWTTPLKKEKESEKE